MGDDEESFAESSMAAIRNGESPHEGLFLIITYLPLIDLLSTRAVCRSLRDAVNHDVLPWLQLSVTPPLSSRLSDNILFQLCAKARGRLTTLALINCTKITDSAIQIVSENNPFITKMYLPGCTSLTIDGIIRSVKTLTENSHTLTSLKINGIYNIDKHHLQMLNTFLHHHHHNQPSLRFYQQFKNSSVINNDDDDPIDVSICPKCDEVRIVFDCSRNDCKCRGCEICIPRCVECSGCFESDEYEEEETACNHVICSSCWLLLLPKCSFCNKPYCNLNDCRRLLHLPNFICDNCCARFVTTTAVTEE
ncbi:F-box protein SKIP28 [Impatiens glandulifera]|uniref:F-box protein SKIP28 n=1 Tax=Impatiens glandulifera TaxID=253017 RepID=UPI001FB0E7D7|nr:F-box protein SKIP28 [Impatiens glandulifera]